MRMTPTLIAFAIAAIIPTGTWGQSRNENLETECQDSGSGMDPRCVGDTEPGTLSDQTTGRQERAIDRGYPAGRIEDRER